MNYQRPEDPEHIVPLSPGLAALLTEQNCVLARTGHSPVVATASVTGSGTNPGLSATVTHDTLRRMNSYNIATPNLSYDAANNHTLLGTGRTMSYDNADELTSSTLSGTTTTYGYQDRGIRHTVVINPNHHPPTRSRIEAKST